jgi:hypothetical protein
LQSETKLPQVRMVPLDAIHKNPDNPRTIKDDKFKLLVKSIRNAPWMLALRPIVVDDEGKILGGNMRYEALKAAGAKEVAVVYASDLTADQKAEFVIKDNVPFGEWNYDMLANLFDPGELADWGLDLWQPAPEGDEDDDEQPKAKKAAEPVICPKCQHEFIP